MLQKLRGNSKGFTLIELMIVIAIIGILAAIAIPNFISYRDKAYCSKAETDGQSVLAALASYFSEPDNTSITGGVQTLIDQEELRLNNPTQAYVTENAGGWIEVEIGDESARCPRAEDASGARVNTFWAFMGTSADGGWDTADQATP